MPLLVPPPASAVGYNSRVFFDDFDSLSTIDLTQSLAPTFNWYITPFTPFLGSAVSAADPSWFSVAGSVLTVSDNHTTLGGFELSTHGYLGTSAPRSVGPTPLFTGGLYIETRFKIGAGSPSFPNSVPTVWLQDYSGILSQVDQTTNHFGEIDVFEYPSLITMKVHDWQTFNGNIEQNMASSYASSLDWTQFQTLGLLHMTAANNGGTGYLKSFVNGNHDATTDITWTAGQDYSIMDAAQFNLFIAGSHDASTFIDYIAVWQTGPAPGVAPLRLRARG